jgi:hypothetical protein
MPQTFEGSPGLPKEDFGKVPPEAKAKTPGRKYASDTISETAKRVAKTGPAKSAPAKTGTKRRARKR